MKKVRKKELVKSLIPYSLNFKELGASGKVPGKNSGHKKTGDGRSPVFLSQQRRK